MNRMYHPLAPSAAEIPVKIEGLLAGTRIATLDGMLPVEFLSPGDRIIARSGTVRLLSLSSLLRRDAEVVMIAASTLGHNRPERDLLVTPEHRVMIRDWRAKVLFGTAAAAIPARRLVDGEFVRLARLPEARFFTLRFAADEVIYAEGLELACSAAELAV